MFVTQIRPTPQDRLGLTISIAILIHALIVFGISFTKEDRPSTRMNTMEIILVSQETKAPEDSNVLAQKNLEGGGKTEEIIEPSASVESNISESNEQIIEQPTIHEELLQYYDVETSKTEVPEILDINKENIETIAIENIENEIVDLVSEKQEPDFVYEKLDETDAEKKIAKKTPPPIIPTSDELLSNSFEIASSNDGVRRDMIEKTQRPRRKFISASTKEYEYATYMDAWRIKVERFGNLNYPEEAKKLNLTGSLRLDVALNKDGTINEITLRKSSGEKLLDDAAIRIVELAAPFAPFPKNIENQVDILHILRTWQFINNKSFR
ncbi:MAG: TonB family protein [Pseudomonadota bacterium]|nr:TonB family protein [Pseudomonadota bacterium]|tara:strand:- start:2152 stop:3126 length:975 start_codon:yes stop_codon:yes gene_type:complete